jgi:hypothetical protein
MKKLLLLLLIAPMIGFSQLLNLPVVDAIIINAGETYTVPDGHILQLASSYFTDDGLISVNNDDWRLEIDNSTAYVYNQRGNVVFPSGTKITWGKDYFVTFVLFDLDAQNLASNVHNQTTPTLYPNPTSSLLALNSEKEYDIEVYDMLGNKLMALTGNSINMEHLSTATYIVKATDKSNNEELTYKVVKN